MLIWTMQTIFISVIFIFIVHNLYGFFKNTLTVPKIKDLVNLPSQNYENMFNILNKTHSSNTNYNSNHNTNPKPNDYDILPTNLSASENPYNLNTSSNSSNSSNIDELNVNQEKKRFEPSLSMKNELKNFFKKKMDSNTTSNKALNNSNNSNNSNDSFSKLQNLDFALANDSSSSSSYSNF